MIIKIKIDVSKIDKSKLYKGTKGTYLDCTLLENRDGTDQYGNDFMVVQDMSKTDREAGIKGAILGNAKKVIAKSEKRSPSQSTPKPESNNNPPPESDDVPF